MDFVASAANIRSNIFGIPLKSRFDIKCKCNLFVNVFVCLPNFHIWIQNSFLFRYFAVLLFTSGSKFLRTLNILRLYWTLSLFFFKWQPWLATSFLQLRPQMQWLRASLSSKPSKFSRASGTTVVRYVLNYFRYCDLVSNARFKIKADTIWWIDNTTILDEKWENH